MLTTMTEQDWIVLQVFQAEATRDKMIGDFSKPCTISWFTTSLGVRFRPNLGIGTVCGNGSGD
jgi:hypothetical protein